MLTASNEELHIMSDEEFAVQIKDIEEALLSTVKTTSFETSDKKYSIRCKYFTTDEAKACIVIVHGFTEFLDKYYEMAHYCLQMGYNVFLYDQRGHGYSSRPADKGLIDIDSFELYADDLAKYIGDIVEPMFPDLPIYLFSHSLGGTVSTLYLARPDCVASRAVLSSPMIRPTTNGFPIFLARAELRHNIRKHGKSAPFNHGRHFTPDVHFTLDNGSPSRLSHYLQMRIDDEHFQTCMATNSWIDQAFTCDKYMLDRKFLANIKAEMLVFTAGRDTTVTIREQYKYVKRLPNARRIHYPTSEHTIYATHYHNLLTYYHSLFCFLGDDTDK